MPVDTRRKRREPARLSAETSRGLRPKQRGRPGANGVLNAAYKLLEVARGNQARVQPLRAGERGPRRVPLAELWQRPAHLIVRRRAGLPNRGRPPEGVEGRGGVAAVQFAGADRGPDTGLLLLLSANAQPFRLRQMPARTVAVAGLLQHLAEGIVRAPQIGLQPYRPAQGRR